MGLSSLRSWSLAVFVYSTFQAKVFPQRIRREYFFPSTPDTIKRRRCKTVLFHLRNAVFDYLPQLGGLRSSGPCGQSFESASKFA